MGGNDQDDTWPDEIFRQMKDGHEKFMRELQEDTKRNDTQQSPSTHTDQNNSSPFVAFRQFVDTNLRGIVDSITQLPQNISELRVKMEQDRERARLEELELWRRWTGNEEDPVTATSRIQKMSSNLQGESEAAAAMLLMQSDRRNRGVSVDKMRALYHDTEISRPLKDDGPRLSPGGACYYAPEAANGGYNQVSTNIWRRPKPAPRWLSIDWFKRSIYSPISLEAHADTKIFRAMWRSAFEDLINASLDKPMDSRPQIGQRIPEGQIQSTKYGPGLDWMLSLQCRGILPPQLPRHYDPGELAPVGRVLRFLLEEEGTRSVWEANFTTPLKWSDDYKDLVTEIQTPAPLKAPSVVSRMRQADTELDLYDALRIRVGNPPLMSDARTRIWDALVDRSGAEDASKIDAQLPIQADPDLRHVEEVAEQASHARSCPYSAAERDQIIQDAIRAAEEERMEDFLRTEDSTDSERQAPEQTKRQRDQLLARGEALVGEAVAWPNLTLSELEDKIARLEQEYEALGLAEEKQAQPAKHGKEQLQRGATDESAEPKKVDVLSSLTTTHTVRLPDGTVTTKVMLKQRFADGREETEEKVHTYQDLPQHKGTQTGEVDGKKASESKKGWFWT